MVLNIERAIKQLIKNKQLEEFLNNEKLLSLKQKDLDQIHLLIIKNKGYKYIKKMKMCKLN